MRSTLLPLLLLMLTSAKAQWELTTPVKTYSQFDAMLMLDDIRGYAVDKSMGVLLRTLDGGVNWERLGCGLTVPRAIHMWDMEHGIVVGQTGSISLTDDGFATFTSSFDPTYGHISCVYFVNDTLGWIGTESGRIYRSIDAGVNWDLMASGQPASFYMTAIQFVDTQIGYASCYGAGMLKSTDGGLTWQVVDPFDPPLLMRDLYFYDEQVGVAVGSAGTVIRTTDGGATWDSIPSNSNYTMRDLTVQGNTMIACGDWGRTIRSADAGLTWTEVLVPNTDHQSLSMSPNGRVMLGTNGRIQRSDDFGLTYQVMVEGTWHTAISKMSFADASNGAAIGSINTGGMESGLLRTTDGGRHWIKAGTGGGGVHLNAAGIGSRGGGSGSFARTLDNFATTLAAVGPSVAIRCTWSISASTHIVGGGSVSGGVYRTTNSGINWTHVVDVGNIIINDLWFVDDMQGYAVGWENFRTMDGGATWQPMPTATGGNTVFFLDAMHGWTESARTTDGGDTWTFMGSTPINTVSIFFTDADTGYVVSASGQTLRSADGGITWDYFLPEIPGATIGDAALVDGTIVAGGVAGDIYRYQISCPQTATMASIAQSGNTLCTSTGGNVQWYWNDELVLDGNTPCLTDVIPGNYYVVVTDAMGCVSAPSSTVQVISTNIADAEMSSIHVDPNPANSTIRISGMRASSAWMTIMDDQGREVKSARVSVNNAVVDISDLGVGLYVARLVSELGTESTGLVKE